MPAEHGSIVLTVTSPVQSFTEPISLAEAKAFLRLPTYSPTDAEADAMVSDLITAAREQAEMYQGRDLVAKQWDLTLDYFPAGGILLREPLVSVDLVKYKNSAGTETTLVATTEYIVDTARALVMPPYGESWPSFTAWPSSAVTIRFTTSAGAVSQSILTGMKLLIMGWHSGQIPKEQASFAAAHMLGSWSRSRFA
jgi:uncharacterized phiE125 gp8 family phage protein